MVIAVDIRGKEAYRKFIFDVFKILIEEYSAHTFLFISEHTNQPSFNFSKDIISVVVKPTKISLLADSKISSLLKKYKADVLVTSKYISQTKVPQCLIAIEDSASRSLKKAKVIVTGSQFSKKQIVDRYKIEENKVEVVYKGVSKIFKPVTFEESEKVKEEYAEGNEFFLLSGAINSQSNLLNLLKAFSAFKKMQKSGMQLLIASNEINQGFLEKLRSFKYKDEVKVLQDISEEQLAAITAAAYAFVYPVSEDYVQPVAAMRTAVPVIVNDRGVLPEICGEAAFYVNAEDHKDIADKMMLVFKDEKLRSGLIDKGKEQIKQYSWDKAATLLWNSIEKAAN